MQETNKYLEKILVFRAVNGDAEAFGSLFDLYAKPVYRYIYFKVNNVQLAEDLSSQAFLKVWEYISQQKKVKSLRSFIYRTARNLVIDYYRSREKEELPLIYLEEDIVDTIKVSPDDDIDKETLKKVLNNLTGEQREIIVLRYIEGMSTKDISVIVDKSHGYVRVIIHRALKELRKYLK